MTQVHSNPKPNLTLTLIRRPSAMDSKINNETGLTAAMLADNVVLVVLLWLSLVSLNIFNSPGHSSYGIVRGHNNTSYTIQFHPIPYNILSYPPPGIFLGSLIVTIWMEFGNTLSPCGTIIQ